MKYFVRYGEIGVKSPKIRRKFENKLIANIKTELDCEFDNDQGRLTLITDENDEKVRDVLGRVFGIVSYSPIFETITDKEKIAELIRKTLPPMIDSGKFNPEKDSFAAKCRRVGNHDFTSQEMAAYAGSIVIDITNAKVNLSHPDFTVYVEVRNDKTFIYYEKIKGLGGLPVGSQGRVVCLISGGIDSPVAAWLMLKRGCSLSLLHCDNTPYGSGTVPKVLENADKLRKYSMGEDIKVYSIKFGNYLEHAQKEAPPRMTCVLCKSGMYQSAEKLAKKEGANAIVDGSSIGQVASQTLNNIEATRYHCKMPIFSPLIAYDKIEIESIAKRIGTYETSIIPDGGCTAVPRYPETHADLDLVKKIIEEIDQKSALAEVAKTISRIDL
ncbi:tRNA uracil 4-sulfurtransferase ThiI [Methanosphaera sp. ISO3-F5]|uniref:tRNA uracil 4-sulfurtransferase ThiI n=1 Tax=Methanosphaera sp. ISO3-F5 TaxID=1452353 RepID=UPI002B259804|nr:tRNA uracil 4-sulfurtransferase ThiI [Methanosphaera sp. ISO3-F5]WQH65080.1 tRNA 4-thiouridine(8) synthase ThiI [Methanosphaera sp. ISO3-F5]